MSAASENKRVLVVDDDEVDRRAVRRALARSGASVEITECATAEQAVAACAEGAFACVLLDYLLPGVTAAELLPRLLPHLRGAPVIVLTGHGDEQIAVELMKAGASDYLSKDKLDGEQLARAIEHARSLADTRSRLDSAERAQRVYLTRLRKLVGVTPVLYRTQTVIERAEAAARIAQEMFGAEEIFLGVVLVDPAVLRVARAPDGGGVTEGDPADPTWGPLLDEARRGAIPPGVRTDGPVEAPRYVVPLYVGDQPIGVLAMRAHGASAAFAELTESLFGQLGELVAVALDNARLYEATRRAVAVRDDVMAVVSHDLRSPLNSFSLGVELLSQAGGGDSGPVITRMQRSIGIMNRLIDDLLDVSRIEVGELRVTPQPTPLVVIMEELAAMLTPLSQASGVQLSIENGYDGKVIADRHRVLQVLSNLVSNALKVTPRGSAVRISVAATGADEVEFRVTDAGPGIAEELRPRVFERYYRKGGRGLGLGLYIAKAIVDAHGGRIWADGGPSGGACFHFTLRRA